MKPTEAQIQQTCTQMLELDGWRALRTDPVSRREWGKGFGEKGMADHLYIRYRQGERHDPVSILTSRVILLDQVMWIEWKRVRFKKATSVKSHQQIWHQAERARGALTLIAGVDFPATIEGFVEWYKSSGLMRKQINIR